MKIIKFSLYHRNFTAFAVGTSIIVSAFLAAPVLARGGQEHGGGPQQFEGPNSSAAPVFRLRGGDFRGPGNQEGPNGLEDEASSGGRPRFGFGGKDATDGGRQKGMEQSCEAKANAIKQRSSQLVNLVNTMLATFDSIATKVEGYYTTQVVTSGKTISNYDSLVSDIQTQKTAVQSALTSANSDQASFSCSSTDPKSQVSQFNSDMKSVKSALAEYRTSIKNLIVAVKGAVGENETQNATGSAQVNQ